jgi:ABC-type multidrug transport system fused ATPase/permease subunit
LEVAFRDVSFNYAPGMPVLCNVNFELRPGHMLGLLGRTGSGKTTIGRLLSRFYDVSAGVIELGGFDVRSIPVDDVRARVGVVTQEVQLFNGTVRDNLTFWDERISDARIHRALDHLRLAQWLSRLPEGLDTKLAAGGAGLSAGEAQLLALTRIFLQDPGLVILDEASARLDPGTERLIETAIDGLLANRTAIVIAHRLSSVLRADDIMVLEAGRVVEHGRRETLQQDRTSRFAQLLRAGLAEPQNLREAA